MPLTDEESRELLEKVRDLWASMQRRRAAQAPKSDHDLSDPVVKFDPRNWKGESMVGRRFSQCPPLFLGQLSHMFDAFAKKNAELRREKYAEADRESASAARAWRAKVEGKPANEKPAASQEDLDGLF